MSATGVETAVGQIRVDEELARRVVDDGPSALGSFELSDEEAAAVVEALRLDVGDRFDEVSGLAMGGLGGLSLDNLIGVGRRLGVQAPGAAGASGWIEVGSRNEGWIDRPGGGSLAE